MSLQRFFISILFLTLTVFTVFGQTEKKIKTIDRIIKQINNDNDYKVKQLLNDYYVNQKNIATDNGQELKGFYKNGELIKIIYTIGISCCMNTYKYYFDNGNLIYIYEKQDNYPIITDNNGEFIGLDYTKLEPAFKGYYYFDNGKMIKTETIGNKIFGECNKKEIFLSDIEEHIKDLKNIK